MSTLRHFLDIARRAALGPLRIRRCILRAAGLVRRHLSRHRSGPDRRHDGESSHRPAVEAVHERAGSADRPAPARLHEPAPHAGEQPLMDRHAPGSSNGSTRSTAAPPRRCWSASRRSTSSRAGRDSVRRSARCRGSIVASPVLADWDPDPDYFFHWFRDSAVVIDALRLLYEAGDLGPEALEHFGDFVRFSLSLQSLDGRKVIATMAWRESVAADFIRFLREDDELACRARRRRRRRDARQPGRHARYLAAGARPQHDGAPLRRSRCCDGRASHSFDPELSVVGRQVDPVGSRLHVCDIGASPPSTSGRRRAACTTTRCVCPRPRCSEGAAWLEAAGDDGAGADLPAEAAQAIRRSARRITGCRRQGHYRSRVLASRSALDQGARYRRDPCGHSCVGRRRRAHGPRSRACKQLWRGSKRCSMRPIRSTRTGRRAGARPWGVMPVMSTSRAARTTSRLWVRPSSAFSRPPARSGRGSLDRAGRRLPRNRSRLHARRTASCRNNSISTPVHRLPRDIWPGATLPSFRAWPPGDLLRHDDNRFTRGLNRGGNRRNRGGRGSRGRPAQPGAHDGAGLARIPGRQDPGCSSSC